VHFKDKEHLANWAAVAVKIEMVCNFFTSAGVFITDEFYTKAVNYTSIKLANAVAHHNENLSSMSKEQVADLQETVLLPHAKLVGKLVEMYTNPKNTTDARFKVAVDALCEIDDYDLLNTDPTHSTEQIVTLKLMRVYDCFNDDSFDSSIAILTAAMNSSTVE
jgi:hypothetical protein